MTPTSSYMRTLGCAKNIVDSKRITPLLQANNFRIVSEPDAAVINTCGIFEDAKRESIDAILEFVSLKEAGHLRSVMLDAALRTTGMVGFPGEGEEKFQELCDCMEEYRFDRLGIFRYSREAATTAFSL